MGVGGVGRGEGDGDPPFRGLEGGQSCPLGLSGSLAPGSHASSPHWGSLLGPCPTHWPWPPLPPPVPPICAASSDACNSPTQAGEAEASLQATLRSLEEKRTVTLGLSAHHSPVLLLPGEEHRGTSVSHLPKQTSSSKVKCQAPLLPGSN